MFKGNFSEEFKQDAMAHDAKVVAESLFLSAFSTIVLAASKHLRVNRKIRLKHKI